MVGRLIRRILGIEEIKNRVENLENDKAGLEGRLIEANQEKARFAELVESNIGTEELRAEARLYLESLNIQLTDQNSGAALMALEAAEIVERYGFKRFVAPIERGYSTPIVTLAEFIKHPEEYIHKLSKGGFQFPIGFNFEDINNILQDAFFNVRIDMSSFKSNNGVFEFALSSMLRSDKYGYKAEEMLVQATELSRLRKTNARSWVALDTLDFLANYEGLVSYIAELPGVNDATKRRAIQGLELARLSYLTALEVIGTTRIKELSDLLEYDQPEEKMITTGELANCDSFQQLKKKIKHILLTGTKGTNEKEIEALLPLRSVERFRRLASEVTAKILANDKERKGLTYEIGKPLEEYSVGEALVLATYFARNVITQYKKIEDTIEDIFKGSNGTEITGKCSDYTGLALHYLREYLVPMQPEKFQNWQFGLEKDTIGDYRHVYIKAMHINPDLSVDVYFMDPTSLANRGIDELKSPKAVIKGLDPSKLPLQIQRDAEDLLAAANEQMEE
jgi:hypothetical protein